MMEILKNLVDLTTAVISLTTAIIVLKSASFSTGPFGRAAVIA